MTIFCIIFQNFEIELFDFLESCLEYSEIYTTKIGRTNTKFLYNKNICSGKFTLNDRAESSTTFETYQKNSFFSNLLKTGNSSDLFTKEVYYTFHAILRFPLLNQKYPFKFLLQHFVSVLGT